MTGAQEGQDSQSQENGLGPERAKKTQERVMRPPTPLIRSFCFYCTLRLGRRGNMWQ